jgi:hypothetical protein
VPEYKLLIYKEKKSTGEENAGKSMPREGKKKPGKKLN